jgi:hypothetical protein
MSIIVITDDTDDHGTGPTRNDFAGEGLTDAGFEFAAAAYEALILRAHAHCGIQPAQFDDLVAGHLAAIPEHMLSEDWPAMGLSASLGRHMAVALNVVRKIDLMAKGLHVADAQDSLCGWVEVSPC